LRCGAKRSARGWKKQAEPSLSDVNSAEPSTAATPDLCNGLGISKMVDTIAQAFTIETAARKSRDGIYPELRAYTARVYPAEFDNGMALFSAYRF
jgi:hypothetical protein